jgi:hypothetical protein
MEHFMRVHKLPPQLVPNMPQMMSQKKPDKRSRRCSLPGFVKQAEHAQQHEDNEQRVRENPHLHAGAFIVFEFAGTFARASIDSFRATLMLA